MITSDVEERVRKIIAERFGLKPEELRDDMSFAEDLMAESVDIVGLIAALEKSSPRRLNREITTGHNIFPYQQ